ncbi:MAG: hypothetical protein JW795_12660 [Chitinivibrionales bacterium]|nr:hypothetical protein [Chitinivibrionales bacterium]
MANGATPDSVEIDEITLGVPGAPKSMMVDSAVAMPVFPSLSTTWNFAGYLPMILYMVVT